MEHLYYGIWDNVAKCYAWVGESKNNATFARMCNVMAKDEKTFIGQAPGTTSATSWQSSTTRPVPSPTTKKKHGRASLMNKRYEEGREPFFSESGEKFRKQYVWTKDEKGQEKLQETAPIDIQQEIESYADECDIKSIVRKASFDPQFLKSLSEGALNDTYTDITEWPQNIHEYHRMIATAQANAMKLEELQKMAAAETEAEPKAKEEEK